MIGNRSSHFSPLLSVLPVVLAILCLLAGTAAVCGKTAGDEPAKAFKGVRKAILIKAPVRYVWKAITSADKFDATVKSYEEKAKQAVVEQKFFSIPILGEVRAVLKVTVDEEKTLTYRMIRGRRLKRMSGGWKLMPVDKRSTRLTLSSFVSPDLPFPQFIVNAFVGRKVKNRLKRTKKLAESMYRKSSQDQSE